MAINIDTLKTRALTSLFFVAVMLAGLLWNQWTFLVLFTVVHFGCWFEFVRLVRKVDPGKFSRYAFLGVLYITVPICMLLDLRRATAIGSTNTDASTFGITIPLLIIFSLWVNDTMAYLVGSVIGKTPFSSISPKKTWEGTIGGAVLCVVAIGFIFPRLAEHYFTPLPRLQHYFIIAGICAVCGTAGDLLESKLKRLANVKDSGSILPGHGGFLDRFDSLLTAVPFVWIYVKLFV